MFPYEQLEAYKKACLFNSEIFNVIKKSKSCAPYLKTQLGRASLSIMLNIAEGSAKNSARDRKNFFTTARGSAFECSSIIGFLNKESEIGDEAYRRLYAILEDVSKLLFVMIRNLENK